MVPVESEHALVQARAATRRNGTASLRRRHEDRGKDFPEASLEVKVSMA
jgi:hypothetical protein